MLLKLFFSDITIGIVLFVSVFVFVVITFLNYRYRIYRKILIVAWLLFLMICIGGCYFIRWSDHYAAKVYESLIESITYHISVTIKDHYASLPVDVDINEPSYKAGMDLIRKQQSVIPIIGSIYTYRLSHDGTDDAKLVLSPAFDMNRDGKIAGELEVDDPPGTPVQLDPVDRVMLREKKLSISRSPNTDKWGTWISAVQPMFNSENEIEAVVGVDFWASDWYQSIYTARICPCTVFYACLLYFFYQLNLFMVRKRDEKNLRLYTREMFSTIESTRLHIVRNESSDNNRQEFLQGILDVLSAHFAVISHNIVIIREQNLLEYKNAVGGYGKALRAINRKSAKILTILDTIHTYINVSTGHTESKLRRVSLRNIFPMIDDNITEWIRRKSGINFTINIDKDAPDEVIINDTACTRILLTLLDNSFQFTERGDISVDMTIQRSEALSQIGRSSSEKWLREFQSIISFSYDDYVNPFYERLSYLVINVTDTGCGIRPKRIQTLFQPFFDMRKNAASPASRFTLPESNDMEEGTDWDIGGASLNFSLCIAQTLARSIGGMIRVVSTPNVGSTFTLFIPVALPSPIRIDNTHSLDLPEQLKGTQLATSQEDFLSGLRLLVVDDNVPHLSYVESTLCQFGAIVEPTDSDTKALELLLSERSRGHFFDVIIINSRLGNLGGENLMNKIRNLGFCRGIILLGTVPLSMKLKTFNRATGSSDSSLPLPLDANQLVRTILKLTKSRRKTTVWNVISGRESHANITSS